MKAIKRANNHSQNIIVRLPRALVIASVVVCVGSGFAQTLSIQSGSAVGAAQTDSIVQIAAESQGLAQVTPTDLPIIGGTFWWVMPGGAAVPAPCPPQDLSVSIYQIADGQFLVDETGGQVMVNTPRFGLQAQSTSSTVASAVASQADAVINLITKVQTAAANEQMRAMGMDVPSPGGDGSGDGGDGSLSMFSSTYSIDTNGLWIQVPTNSLATPGFFTVNVMNTVQGQSYNILTKSNLLAPSWTTALTVTGAVGNVTPVTVTMNNRTNLFVWARVSPLYSFYLVSLPLSQEVFDDDTVTFSVETGGNTNLTYQWTFNGTSIPGATNSSYTIYGTQASDAGNYAVLISDGTNSFLTAAAQLTDAGGTGGSGFIMFITGPRQNYTFRSGVTYVISPYFFGSSVTLYGKTVIEGGAVLKFDTDYSTNANLMVFGDLECQSQPYNPAILTCIDDDFAGDTLEGYGVSTGSPQPAPSGSGPYLELAHATNASIQNLRVCFADQGITTPLATKRLDIWDCQFLECNYGVVNLIPNATNSLHNVLFAGCGAAVGAASNSIAIVAEQVTADVENFFLGYTSASRISLTNSIIFGESSFPNLSTTRVIFNPDPTNFQSEGLANYYLAANSSLHNSGAAGISPRLQTELRAKSTYAPVAFPAFFQVNGPMTLAPQAPRFSGGSPDYGYYYDALDYTVANLVLKGASLTVLPGTAIAVENQYLPNLGSYGLWTTVGFDVAQGSSVYSYATPNKPNIFTAEKQVQETPNTEFANFQQALLAQEFDALWFDAILFVPDYQDDGSGSSPPILNFRFCQFYMPPNDYHVWAGGDDNFELYYEGGAYEASYDSSVYLTMQDCALYGGRINLGNPDIYSLPVTQVYPPGAVSLLNNTFDDTALNLEPTFYQYFGDTEPLNIDLSFQAYNNLFRRSPVIHLEPIPATAGNWVFEDNLFDKTAFIQSVEGASAPLDYGYNGYYPLAASELNSLKYRFGFGTNRLAATTTGDGFVDGTGEITLFQAPPYQAGPLGNFYLPNTTPLYGAGSTNAAGLGLYHYTTRVDQTKEGNDTAKANVNIGVHYVAANSYGQPLDSDGDGIPDYVEDANGNGVVNANETDWRTQYTVPGIWDPTNSVYDDVDLSGDGLTGRAKRILGITPLSQDNPLTLTPVITGEEPYIFTYSMPLSIDVDSNQCVLTLMDNGYPAGGYDFVQQTNGTYLVEWNTTFATNGSHILQVELGMSGSRLPLNDDGTEPVQPVLSVEGTMRIENVNNIIQFDPDDTSFGSQVLYSGTLAVQSADYEIDIYDTNSVLLKTITGHTDNGTLDEVWDLITAGGKTRTDDEFDAQIYITPTGAVANNAQVLVGANGASKSGPIPIWKFKNGSCGDLFTLAYGWNSEPYECHVDRSAMIQYGVENILFSPALDNQYYPTFLNCYDCDPFFMYWNSDQETLLNDLANGSVGNFYWDGHGADDVIGSSITGSDDLSYLGASKVGNRLGNLGSLPQGHKHAHPYRLVILNACECGKREAWADAFGIVSGVHYAEWFQGRGEPSQAMVAWTTDIDGVSGSLFDLEFASGGEHLGNFFNAWMSGLPLIECLNIGATPDYSFGFADRPLDKHWRIFGDPFLTRSPQ